MSESITNNSKKDGLFEVDEEEQAHQQGAPVSKVNFDAVKNQHHRRNISALSADSPPPSPGGASSSLLSKHTEAGTVTVDPKEMSNRDDQPEDNMSKAPATGVRGKDIVRIFQHDNSYIEVTKEQVSRVKKMHASIEDGATASFNYNTLLLVASILAGLGLVSNSTTVVIASMLVSPIMGPVIGLAYGSSIRDWRLVRKSMVTEICSLIVCILIGMAIAGCTGPTDLSDDWPTDEMFTRGTWQNFLVALPVAFFSGLGVAVSLLDEQTASLVGVAISASLLPPAVNAGVLWVAYFFSHGNVFTDQLCQYLNRPVDKCQEVLGDRFQSGLITKADVRNVFQQMATISLLLTLANIVLIWFASMLMFRIKEVLPIKKKVFWDDLGVARKVYQKRAFFSQGSDDSNHPAGAVSKPSDDMKAQDQK